MSCFQKLWSLKCVLFSSFLTLTGCVATNSPQQRAVKNLQKGRIKEDTSYVYALPYVPGTSHFIVQGYYSAYSHKNRAAIDFKMKRGTKILSARDGVVVRVKEDGSYEIPEGNLYAKGTKGTRPEIYVQGNRNPYRISIDQKTGYLYWGEVGPDASKDSMNVRGPRGYDEVNQARKAGFFGWPLFIGNNYAYRAFDFETGKSGDYFDPARPVNASRNNTGMQNLPPAQPAFIWYPYDASPDFPQVGTGGRNAMAGPVYYLSWLQLLSSLGSSHK